MYDTNRVILRVFIMNALLPLTRNITIKTYL